MLTNRDGLRIAVLVNDVASVNVDAATLRATTVELDKGSVEMVELDNGCVCCGPSAGDLAPAVRALTERRDACGAPSFDHIVIELSGVADPLNVQNNLLAGGISVRHKVALVDANAFPAMYNSEASMEERADLAGAELGADPCAIDRRVVDLLLQQIETADAILANKMDLATADELRTTLAACRVLNEKAQLSSTTFGEAGLTEMLPLGAEDGVAAASTLHQHEHSPTSQQAAISECPPGCTNPEHDHGHAHHSHSHADGAACNDPLCSDPEHDHDPRTVPFSAEALGFTTYTYRARRPFSQSRLVKMLGRWPLPMKDVLTLDTLATPGALALEETTGAKDATFANVLRSKGVAWLNQQHRVKATWSHAGRHFQLTPAGTWWATLPDEIVQACLSSDGVTKAPSASYEAERATFAGRFGDRRNELVFIGTNLDTAAIEQALDSCLVTDDEMSEYEAIWSVDDERIAAQNGPFRFAIGEAVTCNVGNGTWAKGKVSDHFYREANWPADRWMPYQVLLDGTEGEYIFAPADMDACIRSAL